MKIQLTTLLASFLATSQAEETLDQCYGLVLSGGFNNGAWEIGVMWGLANYGNVSDYYWDVVSGISAGAINTAGTAGWAPNETEYMVQYLSDQWAGIKNTDIWNVWDNEIEHALFENGVLNDTAGRETIGRIVSANSTYGKDFTVCATDVENGEYVCFNNDNTPYSDLHIAAISSGSVPGIFQPQVFQGRTLMDGGTVWNVNIDSAIEQCLKKVDTFEQITLDVLICGTVSRPEQIDTKNALQNVINRMDIHKYWTSDDNIQTELGAFPGLNVRYYFQESNNLCPINGLNFDGEATWCLQEGGRADAKAMLQIGQEKILSAVKLWNASKKIQAQFPVISDYVYTLLEVVQVE